MLFRSNHNFRITLDENVRFRTTELDLRLGDDGKKVLEDKIIMEIKTLDSIPLWFTKILNEMKIYPSSYSKYGEVYKQEVFKYV